MTADSRPTDSLIHIADLHFWEVVWNPLRLLNKRILGNLNLWFRRRHEFPMERAEVFADEVAATGIQNALLTGDFTTTSTEKECAMGAAFADGLARRGLDLRVMPGNHDVYTGEALRSRRFERHFAPWYPEEGLPALRHLPGGTPMVFVPTVCPDLFASRGRITDGEVEAVAGHLEGCSSPVIVAGHYPLLVDTPGYSSGALRRLRNRGALREALGRSDRRILYVCGHVHRFSFTQDPRYPKLAQLSTGAFFRIARETGTDGEFSEIHVHDDAFRVLRHVHQTAQGRWKVTEEPMRT